MTERYFGQFDEHSTEVNATGDEAHHMVRVMRVKVGQEVVFFNGLGLECRAVVQKSTKQQVTAEIQQIDQPGRESARSIHVATALPKGDRLKFLTEKLTEIGAHQLIPLETAHGVVKASANTTEKMKRWVLEASKQCRRNWLMNVTHPLSAAELFSHSEAASSEKTTEKKFILHPGAPPLADASQHLQSLPESASIWFAIGPEGGFRDDELELAQAGGWHPVALGPRVLRIETAAIFGAVWALTQV